MENLPTPKDTQLKSNAIYDGHKNTFMLALVLG